MSTRLSPDGMYYWDGQQWLSTLSHDGRTRWNGSAWVPAEQGHGPAAYRPPARTARRATSWTRPLQYTVAGWYVLQAVYLLSIPFWMSGPMSQAMNQSIKRQQEFNPTASPPPAEVTNMVTSMMSGVLWIGAVIGLAICVVAIIGALKQWTWVYYVVLVLLGFSVISLPLDVINAVGGSTISAASGFSMPSWTYWLGLATAIPATALFVWMLVALVKRGPWAMTKLPLGVSAAD